MPKNGSNVLDKAGILALTIQREKLDLPTGSCWIKGMTAGEVIALQSMPQTERSSALIAICLCDEQGKRIFSSDEREKLNDLPAGIWAKIINIAWKLSGFDQEQVELLGKGSATTPLGASPSSSAAKSSTAE